MPKKYKLFIGLLLIVLTSLFITFIQIRKGCDENMYISVYSKNNEHLGIITKVKYNINKRAYDLDTSDFEGICDEDLALGYIFVLCDESGINLYSGLIKNIKIDGNKVNFKGDDFRKIFDTEILLDYSQPYISPEDFKTRSIYDKVIDTLLREFPLGMYVDYEIDSASSNSDTLFIANYIGQYLILNAKSFLKVYLAYFGDYIKMWYDLSAKEIKLYVTKTSNLYPISLNDCTFDKTTSDIGINMAMATIKFQTVVDETKLWISSSSEYYNAQLSTNKLDAGVQLFPEPLNDAANYQLGFALKLTYRETGSPDQIYYYQVSNDFVPRPTNLPIKKYFLGTDNNIYEETINANVQIFPVRSKVFEHEFLNKAQFMAISELVDNRFNENIILSSKDCPLDLDTIQLMTRFYVYDKNGNGKMLPVSEIQITNNEIRVKLGFKKTLFTEIVKGGAR